MSARGPLLIVVWGLPASGKTALGNWIAREFQLPLFQKDEFKETLFDTLGWKDRAWSQQLSLASNALLLRAAGAVLAAGQAVLVESNFHPDEAAPQLRSLLETSGTRALQIYCRTDPETLWQRFLARAGERHPGHTDQLYLEEFRRLLAAPQPGPLDIGGEFVEVDTTDGAAIDYAALHQVIQAALSPERGSR